MKFKVRIEKFGTVALEYPSLAALHADMSSGRFKDRYEVLTAKKPLSDTELAALETTE